MIPPQFAFKHREKGMRKLCLVLVLITAIIAPAMAQGTGDSQESKPTAAKSHRAQVAKTSRTASDQQFIDGEKRAWELLKNGDRDAMRNLMSDDAVIVDARGRKSKSEFLDTLGDLKINDVSLDDFKVVRSGPRTAVVSYRVSLKGTYQGRDLPPTGYHTTVLTWRAGRWVGIFHQATPAVGQ